MKVHEILATLMEAEDYLLSLEKNQAMNAKRALACYQAAFAIRFISDRWPQPVREGWENYLNEREKEYLQNRDSNS